MTVLTFPVRRLKTIASIRPSNVDKLARDGESNVALCNYVDVYYNDDITGSLDFMEGTATEAQIEAFALKDGDIVITKDSEAPSDIAVPAYVRASAEGSVCGYHLALVRPRGVNPRFLFWALQAKPVAEAFSIEAKGVTRYGLSTGAIGSIALPFPDAQVQNGIALQLDSETARIDGLVRAKRRMLDLIEEKLAAEIHMLVTRGLDERVTMVETGIETAPTIPRHWRILRLASMFRERSETGDNTLPILTISIAKGISDRELGEEERDRVINRIEDRAAYKIVRRGDLAYNMMRAWQGALGIASVDGTVSPAYVVVRPTIQLEPEFYEALLRTPTMIEEMRRRSKGIINFRRRLYWADAKNMRVQVPPITEQKLIADRIKAARRNAETLSSAVARSVALLLARRASLITALTTGHTVAEEGRCLPMRTLVAAEIIHRHRTVLRFGRVKLQKLLYLAEVHVGIDEVAGSYRREAAGPFDGAMLDDVEAELRERSLYDTSGGDGAAVSYKPLALAGRHDLGSIGADRLAVLRGLVDLVRDLDTRAAEMVATLYAIWNDDLIDGRQVSDDAVLEGVLDDWHAEKRVKFTAADLHHWLAWMKRVGLTPRGTGPRTIPTMKADLFAGRRS